MEIVDPQRVGVRWIVWLDGWRGCFRASSIKRGRKYNDTKEKLQRQSI